MAAPESDRIRERAEDHGLQASEVVEQILGEDLDREKVVERFGADLVDEVETAQEAIEADVKWGLRARGRPTPE